MATKLTPERHSLWLGLISLISDISCSIDLNSSRFECGMGRILQRIGLLFFSLITWRIEDVRWALSWLLRLSLFIQIRAWRRLRLHRGLAQHYLILTLWSYLLIDLFVSSSNTLHSRTCCYSLPTVAQCVEWIRRQWIIRKFSNVIAEFVNGLAQFFNDGSCCWVCRQEVVAKKTISVLILHNQYVGIGCVIA